MKVRRNKVIQKEMRIRRKKKGVSSSNKTFLCIIRCDRSLNFSNKSSRNQSCSLVFIIFCYPFNLVLPSSTHYYNTGSVKKAYDNTFDQRKKKRNQREKLINTKLLKESQIILLQKEISTLESE